MNRAIAAARLLGAALVLGACQGGGDDGATGTSTSTAAAATSTSAAVADDVPDASIRIVLGAGRLHVGGNALVVGAPGSQVDAYLERALGRAGRREARECDPGRLQVSSWPGLTVYVADDGFAGWYADDDTFATGQGVAVGSTAEALRSAYPAVEVRETTLGTEAFVPDDADDDEVGLTALLEGDRIRALWSGATCVAR